MLVEQPKQIEPDLFRKLRNQIKSLVVGATETSVAIEPLVWTPEAEDNATHTHNGLEFRNQRLPWWLDYVRGFGNSRSPLIVVQNQIDKHGEQPEPEAAAACRGEFDFYRSVPYSAATDDGRGTLDGALADAARRFNPPLIGQGRLKVMQQLREMRAHHRTLDMAEYEALCTETGQVSNPAQFLRFLHNTGEVFWREGLFDNQVILDQSWVLDAIYTVLDRERCLTYLKQKHGRFTRDDLALLTWDQDGYSKEEQNLFLTFMQSCGICFTHRRGGDGFPAEYIAPDLLPDDWSDADRADRWGAAPADAETLLTYDALAPALLRNLICAIGERAGLHADYWRNGLYAYEQKNRLPHPDRTNFEGGLDRRPSPSKPVAATLGDCCDMMLEALEEARTTPRPQPHSHPSLSPYVPRHRSRCRLWLPSKSHSRDYRTTSSQPPTFAASPDAKNRLLHLLRSGLDDKTDAGNYRAHIVDQLCARAKAAGVRIRRDKNAMTVGDSISEFMQRLGKADRVIVILSDKYLKSHFCMTELFGIWREARCDRERFVKRIRVFSLNDIAISSFIERAKYADYWHQKVLEVEQVIQAAPSRDRTHVHP